MLSIFLILALPLLLLFAFLPGWLFWKAEAEARAKIFDSSIDHVSED